MFQEKNKLNEAAHIAEELFSNQEYELNRQCESVHHAETRGILTREKALKAFKVTPVQYTEFLAKNTSRLLLPSEDAFLSWSDSVIAVNAMSQTLKNFASRQSPPYKARLKHLSKVLRAMQQLSEDVGQASILLDE